MSGIPIVLMMILIRLVFPIGMVLCLGEWVRRRETQYWLGKSVR